MNWYKLLVTGVWLLSSLSVGAMGAIAATDDQGRPPRRVSGGSRGGCELAQANNTSLLSRQVVALIPETTAAIPTTEAVSLWIYIPFKSKDLTEFRLKEEMNGDLKTIQQGLIPAPQQGNLIKVTLPAKALTVGKNYQWVFSVRCVPTDPSKDLEVSGWVRRVEVGELNPQLRLKLKRAKTSLERVQVYTEAGLSYQAIDTAFSQFPCTAQNKAAFANLLRSLQLNEIKALVEPSLPKSCPAAVAR